MATTTKPLITAEEFLRMDLGEGLRELVRGEVIEIAPGEYWHGLICVNIANLLLAFGRQTGHGHVASNDSTVGISDLTVRGADVCYYSEARWPRARVGQERPPVPPDLVVEVYSPSNRPAEMLEKVADYLSAGVPMIWIVHPRRRTLAIYRGDDPTPTVLNEADVVEGIPELPGFRCQVAEFFA
jgi:Uma2 family endonuclease